MRKRHAPRQALAQSFAQNVLIYSTAGAASSQLAVDQNRRQTTNAVLFSPAGGFVLMHVVNAYFMFRASELFHCVNSLLAGCATSAEDLNRMFHC